MKRSGKNLPPAAVFGMLAAAAVLILSGSVGGARAALTYYSETYSSRVQMYDIGVTLMENDAYISWRDYDSSRADGAWEENTGVLLEHMLPVDPETKEPESLKLGMIYPEELKVKNTGTINQYVRVSICKYWTDPEGNRLRELSPDLIDLHLTGQEEDGGWQSGSDWQVDEAASTAERTVLYYTKLLMVDEETSPFADTLRIDDSVARKVTEKRSTGPDGHTTIVTTCDYDGVKFQIEAKVDAVQEHNAQDAAWSVWGRNVKIEENRLSLAD